MSQHHLTVKTVLGTTLKLIAGWDWPLRRFFLTLRDTRLPELESECDLTPAQNELYDSLTNYDSDETMQGLRSIGDVENCLACEDIPFSDEEPSYNAAGEIVQNPKLLRLLCEILTEKDSPRPKLDQKVKFWDDLPAPVLEDVHPRLGEYISEHMKRYTEDNPHPVYTLAAWNAAKPDLNEWFATQYENWVRRQIVDEFSLIFAESDAQAKLSASE